MGAVLLFGLQLAGVPQPSPQLAIDWRGIDSGSGTSSGGQYSVSGTIGQPDAGTMSGGRYELEVCPLDGLEPTALIEGTEGNLYGTLAGGGKGEGLVFKVKRDGTGYEVLHHFSGCLLGGADGSTPQGLIEASDGALYGTTNGRGAKGGGTLFSLKPDGSGFRVLHSFPSSTEDGGNPHGALVWTSYGGLYGMTRTRQNQSAAAVFRLSLPPPRSRSP